MQQALKTTLTSGYISKYLIYMSRNYIMNFVVVMLGFVMMLTKKVIGRLDDVFENRLKNCMKTAFWGSNEDFFEHGFLGKLFNLLSLH